jgi:hypothetical protein
MLLLIYILLCYAQQQHGTVGYPALPQSVLLLIYILLCTAQQRMAQQNIQ